MGNDQNKVTEEEVLEAFQKYRSKVNQYSQQGSNFDLIHYACYYKPDSILVKNLINEIEELYQKKRPTQREKQLTGYKLEELTLAIFHGLKGWDSIKNYQSSTAQYDLLMSGNGLDWQSTLGLLPLNVPRHSSSIVVEAKATKAKVNDPQFSRLCCLMQQNLKKTSVLGVFLTLNGATGFPKSETLKNIGQCRLRQLVFYAETRKPIVVLDINDIRKLSESGSLLKILNAKIREIEEQTGLPTPEDIKEVALPKHLSSLYEYLTC
jgi:hypothetical protein